MNDPASALHALPRVELPAEPSGPARPASTLPEIRIGGYRVVAQLEPAGGVSILLGFRATPFGLTRRAQLKWVPRNQPEYGRARLLLQNEARTLANLDHPNLLGLLDCGEDETGAFLALEYSPGVDLLRVMNRLSRIGERLPFEQAMFITLELLRGLEHAHRARDARGQPAGVLHRNMNPSNVLVSGQGQVRITGFGAPRVGEVELDLGAGGLKSKLRYQAPECLRDPEANGGRAADVYSVGVMLFELLLGVPWVPARVPGAVLRQLLDDGLPLGRLDEIGLPGEIRGIVALATERDPARRFESAQEMAAATESWLIQRGLYLSPSVLAAYLRMCGLLTEADIYEPQVT